MRPLSLENIRGVVCGRIAVHLYISQRRLIHRLRLQISFSPVSFPSTYHNVLGQEGTRSSKTKLGSFVPPTRRTRRGGPYAPEEGEEYTFRSESILPLERSSAEWSV